MRHIDLLIDRITMYRLILYFLVFIIIVSMFLGAIGSLPFSPYSIVISTLLFVGICFSVNYAFAKIYDAPTNWESSIITGLILALIITPMASLQDIPFIGAAAGLAIASKYILVFKNKHIFNPAAIAVVLTAFGPQESASWWVGSTVLLPIVIIGGLIIVRKVRRSNMVFIFIATVLISTTFFALISRHNAGVTLQDMFLHSSLFFFAFVMLTEPLTSPTTKIKRYIYAILVGILFAPTLHIGGIYSTPELALIIGNIVAFLMSPIVKTKLSIGRRRFYGHVTEDIELIPETLFKYNAGQYVEMTLPHTSADSRGLRRYFTLASSPTEDTLRIGIRYYENGSSFKSTLREAGSDTPVSIGQLGGDFTLPKDSMQKLAFIAGGIGITPFRSMVKYLSDTDDHRSVKLLYSERNDSDVTYSEVFEQARSKTGVETLYVITSSTVSNLPHSITGRIDDSLIKSWIPDYADRLFYVSGPRLMVVSVREALLDLGVYSDHIKVDYFSGYA